MSKIIIYGAGLAVVAFVVGLLLFLTFDNAASGQAIYGNRFDTFTISGPASILVNTGIVGLAFSFLAFIAFLLNRSPLLLKSYKLICFVSGIFIFIGLVSV